MKRQLTILVLVALGVTVTHCFAAVPEDFALKVENVSGTTDEVLVVGSWKIDGIQGWSWGLCHNKDDASIGDCAGQAQPPNPCEGGCANTTCPDDMATAGLGGAAVSFHSLNIYEDGITQGVVLDFTMTHTLDATDRFEMLKIKYVVNKRTEVKFCTLTLGVPPVEDVFVHNGESIAPAVEEGTFIGEGQPPACQELKIKLGTVEGASDKVQVLLDTTTDQAISGFQFGVKQDSADLEVLSIDPGSAFGDFDVKTEGFWGVSIIEGQGATLGALLDLEPQGDPPQWFTLPAETCDQQIAVVSYQCSASATGQTATGNVTLTEELGDPPVEIVVDVDGTSLDPTVDTAAVAVSVECVPPVAKPFVRGDANQDGRYTVSDGVAIAKAVFGEGSKLPLIQKCMDSADADDNGEVNTADAIYLLTWLFLDGPEVPAPLGTCGQDPTTDDQLTCEEYQCP